MAENEIYKSNRTVYGKGTVKTDYKLFKRGIKDACGLQTINSRKRVDYENDLRGVITWITLAGQIIDRLKETNNRIDKGENLGESSFKMPYVVGGSPECLLIPVFPEDCWEPNDYAKEIAIMRDREAKRPDVQKVYSM